MALSQASSEGYNLALQSSTTEAPILRLDRDVWSLLSIYVLPNDLVRLCMLSTSIASRIKLGTRSLKLSWSSIHYIDVSTVLSYISQHPHVSEVSFESQDGMKPHWTPVDWISLPTGLTSLSLSFAGSVTSLFDGNHRIGELLPNLSSLRVSEEVRSQDPPYYSIRLHCLPSSLLELKIMSHRMIQVPSTDFESLPATLITLALDLRLILVDDRFGPHAKKMDAPRFPPNLTTLSYGQEHPRCHLVLSNLPRSLQSLDFRSCSYMEVGSSDAHAISTLEGSSSDLPWLKTFLLPRLYLTAANAASIIPSSVTRLAVLFVEAGIQEDTSHIFSKLVSYQRSWRDGLVCSKILDGSLPSPCLERLDTLRRDTSVSTPTRLLPRGTPPGLREVSIDHPQFIANFLQNLRLTPLLAKVELKGHLLPLKQLLELPDTLEFLNVPLLAFTLAQLFDAMRTKSRFPNLKHIQAAKDIPGDSLASIPPQLRELVLELTLPLGVKDRLRTTLRAATQLTTLTIELPSASSVSVLNSIELMKTLPPNLTRFRFLGGAKLSNNWPIVFPESLTALECMSRSSSKEVGEVVDPAPPVFPPKLRKLAMSHPERFNINELPAFLSEFKDLHHAPLSTYFNSRRHPDAEQASYRVSIM